MRLLDLISGLFWLSVSVAVAGESYRLGLGTLHRPGSGLFPFIAALLLGSFSLALVFKAIVVKPKLSQQEETWPNAKGWPRAAFVLAALVLYVLFLEKLGFIIATALILCALPRVIGSQSWSRAITFSLLATFASYFLFQICLKAQLPQGLFGLRAF